MISLWDMCFAQCIPYYRKNTFAFLFINEIISLLHVKLLWYNITDSGIITLKLHISILRIDSVETINV